MKFQVRVHALVRPLVAAGILAIAAPVSAQEKTPRILIDSIHAHNWFVLAPGGNPYDYHYAYGFKRAFNYLKENGVQVDEVKSGRLDAAKLAEYDQLFINLASADLPPFRVDEINAIKDFVENGGGLFVITDHSNCYYHAYKMQPLLEQLGVEVTLDTACDRLPFSRSDGNGWINIFDFAPHPVTQGLKAIGIQTGGTVDQRFAVAKTSEQSWGDEWYTTAYGEKGHAGFYGNWRQDPEERKGPLGVVLAKEFGKGRITIVADQNVFGDPFLNYGDNYRLWLNAQAWLLRRPELAETQRFLQWHGKKITAYEDFKNSTWGRDNAGGYFNVFGSLLRKQWVFASDNLLGPQDLILFAHDGYNLSETNMQYLLGHLRSGKNVIMLGTMSRTREVPLGILGDVRKRVGEPAIEQSGSAKVWKWPGMGQIVVLSSINQFRNSRMPAPERTPTAEQEKLLDGLNQVIEAAGG